MRLRKTMKAADLREVLSEIEEAAKPFQTMEEWFVHVEEYTEALKKKEQQKNRPGGCPSDDIACVQRAGVSYGVFDRGKRGTNPYQKAEKEQNVEEERRLFYVGMTRAKDVLKITYVKIKTERRSLLPVL